MLLNWHLCFALMGHRRKRMNNKQIYFLFTGAYIPIQTAVPVVSFAAVLVVLPFSFFFLVFSAPFPSSRTAAATNRTFLSPGGGGGSLRVKMDRDDRRKS